MPEFARGEAGAFRHGREFRPNDGGIDRGLTNPGAVAAIAAGDDVLASDEPGVTRDPLRDQLGMLDEVRFRFEHAGDEDLAFGQADALEKRPFMALFTMLETKEAMVRLLDATREGAGVQIYIGADNPLFGIAGCSMIVAPYRNSREQMVGAIGILGPTRINYARIIPLVDYTAKVIGRLLG